MDKSTTVNGGGVFYVCTSNSCVVYKYFHTVHHFMCNCYNKLHDKQQQNVCCSKIKYYDGWFLRKLLHKHLILCNALHNIYVAQKWLKYDLYYTKTG